MFGIDIVSLVQSAGYAGLFAIVFVESGLLVGFFFPGDSLLFTAGLLAAAGVFNVFLLIPLVFTAAVMGDSTGYAIGKKAGETLFDREDSLFFKKSYLAKTARFYERHGNTTIILARFVPVVRTFAPVLAGVGSMRYGTFILYNIVGGFLWSFGITLAGFFLGRLIPDIDHYLLPIVTVIILLSLSPLAREFFARNKSPVV